MIADDEKLVLEDLETIVDWEAHGFEIVATAVNGKQALSKFQQYHPQVVFTDIKMPFMDGIQLIEHVRAIDTKTQIIVLTAYEDFAYAKSAIQHGILDYVIKSTIDTQVASTLLNKVRTIIENQGQVLDILMEKKISDYFFATEVHTQESDKILFHTPYCYMLVEQDLPIDLEGDNEIESIRFNKAVVTSILAQEDSNEYKIVAVSTIPQDRILIVLEIQKYSQKAINEIMYQCAIENKRKLQEQLQMEFSIYVVSSKMNLIELKRWYKMNSQLFYQKYIIGTKEVYHFADLQSSPNRKDVVLDAAFIGEQIEKSDIQEIKNYLERLFPTINSYKNLCSVSRELYNLLKRNFNMLPEYLLEQKLNFDNNWKNWLNAKLLRNWFVNTFTELLQEKRSVYQNQYSKVIVRAIEYIYRYYSNSELTINNIADDVKLSAGYLCVLFKKETGKTLNNFISEVRIIHAKRLLREKQLKVYEISTAVGFQSSQYFSQLFYKQVGIYPNEYQKGK